MAYIVVGMFGPHQSHHPILYQIVYTLIHGLWREGERGESEGREGEGGERERVREER